MPNLTQEPNDQDNSGLTDKQMRDFMWRAGYRVGVDADALRFAALMGWCEGRMQSISNRTVRRQTTLVSFIAVLIGSITTAVVGGLISGVIQWHH